MKLTLIGTMITFFGFFLVAASILIIFLGKKVGGDSSQPQRIKIGKLIEARTNSVLMLVIICALFTLSPLLLAYLMPMDLSLSINGQVFERTRATEDDTEIEDYAKNVDITLERKIGDNWEVIGTETTDNQGSFDFSLPPPPIQPDEKYRITWKKEGYGSGQRKFRYSRNNLEIHLKQTGGF